MGGPSASSSALPGVTRFGDEPCSKTLDGATEPNVSQNVGGPICTQAAGIRQVNRICTSLNDWQATIIGAEHKTELARGTRPMER